MYFNRKLLLPIMLYVYMVCNCYNCLYSIYYDDRHDFVCGLSRPLGSRILQSAHQSLLYSTCTDDFVHNLISN